MIYDSFIIRQKFKVIYAHSVRYFTWYKGKQKENLFEEYKK